MTANERRAEIMRILTSRRRETAAHLATELNVSVSTVYRDVLTLTAEYPLDTKRGNGGCIQLADWYHPHRSILSAEQQNVIARLMDHCDDYQAHVLQEILLEYGSPKYAEMMKTKEMTIMGKILLTGGAGYIGAHTCVELLNAGYDIVVVDNYYNSTPESLRRVSELTGKKFSIYEADCCDAAAMEEIFSKEPIEAVIHFAGYKAVGESVAKPVMYYRNNLDATLTLLEVMAAHGVKKILFSSSATVYGTDASADCREDLHLTFTTSNPYGTTKYMIERILEDVYVANPDMSIVELRYFNPVGAHESGMLGEDPNGIPNNLMPRVLRAAQGKMAKLGVFGNDYPTPDGTCRRDYIHVVDLAKGHVAALKYAAENTGCEKINLGTGVPYSVLEILNAFEKATGVPVPYEMADRRPGDLPESYANADKALKLLGWKAEKTLEDMCRDSWRWQTKNPNGYKG